MSKPAPSDDSDLEDLLSHNKSGSNGVEEAPLNLDHLTQGQLDVPKRRSTYSPGIGSIVSMHCSYLCYAYPRLCGCITFGVIGAVMFVLMNAVLNPTETFGVIANDYSAITSQYDLSMNKIDHWCLKGDNDSCRCDDPLEPQARGEFRTWTQAHKANKEIVNSYKDSDFLDVAFLGESLVEEMDGRWMGRPQGDALKGVEKSFRKQFKRSENSNGIEGVALGIAGDTVRSYRCCFLERVSKFYSLFIYSLPTFFGEYCMVRPQTISIPAFGGYRWA